jgi:hypothetical protein
MNGTMQSTGLPPAQVSDTGCLEPLARRKAVSDTEANCRRQWPRPKRSPARVLANALRAFSLLLAVAGHETVSGNVDVSFVRVAVSGIVFPLGGQARESPKTLDEVLKLDLHHPQCAPFDFLIDPGIWIRDVRVESPEEHAIDPGEGNSSWLVSLQAAPAAAPL